MIDHGDDERAKMKEGEGTEPTMSVTQLKDRLRELNLSTSGRKWELVNRLKLAEAREEKNEENDEEQDDSVAGSSEEEREVRDQGSRRGSVPDRRRENAEVRDHEERPPTIPS